MSGVPSNNDSETKGMGWLLPLFLLLLVAALILYFLKGSNTSPPPVAKQFVEAAETSANKKVVSNMDSILARPMEIELPNDSVVVGSRDGIELHLVEYLNNPKDTINKNRWFNFDSLSFENNAQLTTSSIHQIQNIIAILNAYPKMKIKIGAFTDKTNSEVDDLKLTGLQAMEVVTALKKAGANPAQIIGAEGYGSKFAKAPSNAPLAERMKDRRVSINVTEK